MNRRPAQSSAARSAKPLLETASTVSEARRFASIFGPPPASFTSAIRQLMADDREGRASLSAKSEWHVNRLVKGPTFLAALYYATKTRRPERWEQGPITEAIELARIHEPALLSAIIALSYLFKKAKRLSDPDEFRFLGELAEIYGDAGLLVGMRCPAIGDLMGWLGGAMIPIAMAAFGAEDKTRFQDYRRSIKGRVLFDEAAELKRWGCTSYQVASCLLVLMGFHAGFGDALCRGFSRSGRCESGSASERARLVRTAVEALISEKPPALPGGLSACVEEARPIVARGGIEHWMSRTKEDARSAELARLVPLRPRHAPPAEQAAPAESLPAAAAGGDPFAPADLPARCAYEELPPSLQAEISREEFDQLKHLPLEEIVALFE